ncbi:LPD29 domain-containing protein [Tsukamurella ocularis]|uniref:LPD29 domain-containing protein n=1 Tax=Tsukamurella ocularis TaxID=1970234 RepID=UPI002167CEE5|nr:LPD29 domain-containing protein [Tsukamurella ocularis]MCS3853276.1 hypothetical protein [Tsukamurella ocularis]
MSTTEKISTTDTAKLVRKALRAQWPTEKFGVRRPHQSTWRLEIRWTNGPTEADVRAATVGFIGCRTDQWGALSITTYEVEGIHYIRTVDLDVYKRIAAALIEQNTPRIAPEGLAVKIQTMTHIEHIRHELRQHADPRQAVTFHGRAVAARRNDLAAAVDHVIDSTPITTPSK